MGDGPFKDNLTEGQQEHEDQMEEIWYGLSAVDRARLLIGESIEGLPPQVVADLQEWMGKRTGAELRDARYQNPETRVPQPAAPGRGQEAVPTVQDEGARASRSPGGAVTPVRNPMTGAVGSQPVETGAPSRLETLERPPVVEDEEVVLERAIRGLYQQLEGQADQYRQEIEELEEVVARGYYVGAEIDETTAEFYGHLNAFVDRLNRNGARFADDSEITVERLVAGDDEIDLVEFELGNFQVPGFQRFESGADLLEAIADEAPLAHPASGVLSSIDDTSEALSNIQQSIEARPEIEAEQRDAQTDIRRLRELAEPLESWVENLRAAISEVDTGGRQPDPLSQRDQLALVNLALDRWGGDERFDFSGVASRYERAQTPGFGPIAEEGGGFGEAGAGLGLMDSRTPLAPSERHPLADLAESAEPAAPAPAPPAPAAPPVSAFQGPPAESVRGGRPPAWEGAGEMLVGGRPVAAGVAEAEAAAITGADVVDTGADVVDTSALTALTGGGGGGGGGRLTAAQIRDANQQEVEALLASQFGGFSFFLQKHRSDLQVGLTADGQVVPAGDPSAASAKSILDVIVDQGITAPTRVLGMLENTEWWKKTDARMREYDVLTADMSEPQKTEYLEPVLDLLREEAQFLGFQLDPTRARDLAEQITRMGEETDSEYIRGLLTAEQSFNAAEVTASGFAAARDEIVAMSKRYFTPINEADAAAFAEDIYVGTKTAEGVEQYFREMAANKMPQLQNSLNAGITPEQYFAPYKYEIEKMLDRPNVDLYEEFGDVVQYIPDTGTGEARPMTLGEVRKYVRGLDEWQQSSQGTDSARALAFSIGRTFGEVA